MPRVVPAPFYLVNRCGRGQPFKRSWLFIRKRKSENLADSAVMFGF